MLSIVKKGKGGFYADTEELCDHFSSFTGSTIYPKDNEPFNAAEHFKYYSGYLDISCLCDEAKLTADDITRINTTVSQLVASSQVSVNGQGLTLAAVKSKYTIARVDCYRHSVRTACYLAWYQALSDDEEAKLGKYCPCDNCTHPNYFSLKYWLPITHASGCRKHDIYPSVKVIHQCRQYLLLLQQKQQQR